MDVEDLQATAAGRGVAWHRSEPIGRFRPGARPTERSRLGRPGWARLPSATGLDPGRLVEQLLRVGDGALAAGEAGEHARRAPRRARRRPARARGGPAVLLDLDVAVGEARDLRQVRDDQDLAVLGEAARAAARPRARPRRRCPRPPRRRRASARRRGRPARCGTRASCARARRPTRPWRAASGAWPAPGESSSSIALRAAAAPARSQRHRARPRTTGPRHPQLLQLAPRSPPRAPAPRPSARRVTAAARSAAEVGQRAPPRRSRSAQPLVGAVPSARAASTPPVEERQHLGLRRRRTCAASASRAAMRSRTSWSRAGSAARRLAIRAHVAGELRELGGQARRARSASPSRDRDRGRPRRRGRRRRTPRRPPTRPSSPASAASASRRPLEQLARRAPGAPPRRSSVCRSPGAGPTASISCT